MFINRIYAQSIKVIDSLTLEPLAYANIINLNTSEFFLTNTSGEATMNCNKNDTIEFSYLGYISKKFICEQMTKGAISLNKAVYNLDEFTVIADNEYLYRQLEMASKKLIKVKPVIAKSFMQLETEIDLKPVELVQAFFNADINKGDIDSLKLKSGRIGIKDNNGQFYISLGTSKTICNLELFEKSDLFPLSPFISFKTAKKNFILSRDFENKQFFVIKFDPKEKSEERWSGELWIDPNSKDVVKIILSIDNSKKKPFYTIRDNSYVENLNMNLEISYKENTQSLFKFDFTYDYVRKAENRTYQNVHSEGILHIYDFNSTFFLPYFQYDDDNNDYRKISFIPYNEEFWNKTPVPDFTEKQLSKLDFFKKEGVIMNFQALDKRSLKNNGFLYTNKSFFEHNNLIWSKEDRWTLSPIIKEGNLSMEKIERRHNLYPQLFLDVNIFNDSISYLSKTVLDVFRSEYKLPNEPIYNRFFNIFFDLCEIERRKLDKKLTDAKSAEEVDIIYKSSIDEMNKILKNYKNEVNSGENLDAMKRYNEIVFRELGIDNFITFPLEKN